MKKIFVIGDSISMHYGPYIEEKLRGKYGYGRKTGREGFLNLDNPMGANNGDSSMVVDYMERLKALSLFDYDLFLINCGLHDIKTTAAGRQVEVDDYEKNLRRICALADSMGVPMLWLSTTPVNDACHAKLCSAFERYNQDVLLYNEIAARIMKENGKHIIDLYGLMERFLDVAYADHVHFSEEYKKMQAEYICTHIEKFFEKEV